MIWHSFKIAIRNIVKNRQSYLLNITGLIIALTVCFITLFYAVFEHSFEKNKFNTDNVYEVHEYNNLWDWSSRDIPLGLSNRLANNTPGVNAVIKYTENGGFQIEVGKDRVFKEWTFHFVDTNYMELMKKTMISGNCFLRKPDDVLLTKDIALKYYGTTNCIGEKITVHGHHDQVCHFRVSGVFDYPAQRNIRPAYNLIARFDIYDQLHEEFDHRDEKTKTYAYLILDKVADRSTIINQIQNYYTQNFKKDYYQRKSVELKTPKEHHFEYVGKRVNTAITISIVILFVALINFIIYNNAQFWKRSKAVGIHKITGSKPIHILSLSFSEYFIINSFSILIAFFLAIALAPFIGKLITETFRIEYLPLVGIFFYGLALAFVISLLASLSSLFLSTRQPIKLVNQQLNKGVKGKVVNSTLITLQVATTTFLIIVFFATNRQLNYIQNIDWGFDSEEVLYVKLDEALTPERFNEFKNRIRGLPGIIAASGCWHVPPTEHKFFIGYNDENGNVVMIDRNPVGYSYINTMGIKLKSGRDFNKTIDKPGQSIIVNQEFLKVKNITNPYDTLLKIDDRYEAMAIIGVIDNYHIRGMHEKITPQLIELDPDQSKNLLIKIAPNNVMTTLAQIEKEYKAALPNTDFKFGFIEDDIQGLYKDQKNYNTLISYYTLISLIIACMGLLGFVISEMNKRIKEIGIRKVNGAKIGELLTLLNQDFLKCMLTAFLIACPLAFYFINKWLENFAYKIPVSWWIFALSGLLAMGISLLTVSFQSWRAASRNPVEALRYE